MEEGCTGCTGFVNAPRSNHAERPRYDFFVLISRAPLEKLERYKARQGWNLRWISSLGSDFNYDFHVTLDSTVTPVQYNHENLTGKTRSEASSASTSHLSHLLDLCARL